MLIGEYRSKVGEKKRVSLPNKLRKELGKNLILTRGYEKSLVLVNKEMWESIAGEVVSGSFINKSIRDTSRFLIGSASEINPDNQGRIVIPQGLYEYAQLSKEAVFIGLVNWVEIWDKKNWKARLNYLKEHGDEIADELSKMSSKK